MIVSRIAIVLILGGLVAASQAFAQESRPGPGAVEISIVPGGGMFFTESNDSSGPSFGNYDLGGAVTVNLTRYFALEGEVSGALGVTQDLSFGGLTEGRTPNFLNYSGNAVVLLPNQSSVVPYVTGGIGALSMFEKASLGIDETETFLTANVGGGVKWYSGRWGLRGDYRFVTVRSKDDAPAFFGQETRYGHRVFGGVILNVGS